MKTLGHGMRFVSELLLAGLGWGVQKQGAPSLLQGSLPKALASPSRQPSCARGCRRTSPRSVCSQAPCATQMFSALVTIRLTFCHCCGRCLRKAAPSVSGKAIPHRPMQLTQVQLRTLECTHIARTCKHLQASRPVKGRGEHQKWCWCPLGVRSLSSMNCSAWRWNGCRLTARPCMHASRHQCKQPLHA